VVLRVDHGDLPESRKNADVVRPLLELLVEGIEGENDGMAELEPEKDVVEEIGGEREYVDGSNMMGAVEEEWRANNF
jgi:IS4 transposase